MRRAHLLACTLVVGLAACGGGGSDGTPNTGANSAPAFPPQTPLVYSGATTAASLTATTSGTIASNVIGAGNTVSATGLVTGVSMQSQSGGAIDPQPTGISGLSRRLGSALREATPRLPASDALTGAAVDSTTACSGGGSVRMFGNTSDSTGTGTVNIHYLACRIGMDTINGPSTLRIDSRSGGATGLITDSTLTFVRVAFTGPGIDTELTGTLRAQVVETSSSATETLTQNMVMQNNITGRMLQTQNLRVVNVYDDIASPSFMTQAISGRLFDSVAGYVDVATNTVPFTSPWGPLYFSVVSQSFPDWGEIVLTGATGRVRVTSLGNALAKVEVDPDGDGTYDQSARMRWVDFNTAIGADLADSDGDGMHNSWETAKGLNPNVANAAQDADGDGYSNLTEYLRGSEPGSLGSVPGPVRNLWVSGVRDLAVDAGGQFINVFTGATGEGVQLNPETRELGAQFSGLAEPGTSGNLTVTDASGTTFTLSPTADPRVWTLTSSTGGSFTVTNVAGVNPGSLIRYGTRGIAFRTVGTSGPGYVYLVESATLIP